MSSEKKRFNIIDFVIIVVVLGCIAGLLFRYNFVERIIVPEDTKEMIVGFMAEGVSPEIAEHMNNSSEFLCSATDNYLGKPYNLKKTDAKYYFAGEDLRAEQGVDNTKKDIKGNFKVKGVMTDDGFLLEGTQFIAPGKEITIQSEDLVISVIITEIK
ncbi:MAG: DUF4330 family protein [Ruminococcaceae bacterium]|nr:DUF4330 family protein [Oscillospiraceae bacterium]